MSKCEKCKSMHSKNNVDCSLINIYENEKLAKEIPSIWTDWYNRLNFEIMIIGQDWGPYSDMKKLHEKYLELRMLLCVLDMEIIIEEITLI